MKLNENKKSGRAASAGLVDKSKKNEGLVNFIQDAEGNGDCFNPHAEDNDDCIDRIFNCTRTSCHWHGYSTN